MLSERWILDVSSKNRGRRPNRGVGSDPQLRAGLYRMSFTSQRGGPDDANVGFPWAKLEAPPGARPGRSVVAVQGENGWLSRTGDTALVQVAGERAPLLLTIYQVTGASP